MDKYLIIDQKDFDQQTVNQIKKDLDLLWSNHIVDIHDCPIVLAEKIRDGMLKQYKYFNNLLE